MIIHNIKSLHHFVASKRQNRYRSPIENSVNKEISLYIISYPIIILEIICLKD